MDCWSFHIFDENGLYIVLLQDHYGPYHVVTIKDLKDYLTGKTGPYEVVAKIRTVQKLPCMGACNGLHRIHSNLRQRVAEVCGGVVTASAGKPNEAGGNRSATDKIEKRFQMYRGKRGSWLANLNPCCGAHTGAP